MDESKDAIITTNYTKAAIKRLKKQQQKLISKTAEMINYMLEAREEVVAHVFKFTSKSGIHIPVHFRRIINNIHNQLSIQSNSLVNITSLELYELLDGSLLPVPNS